MSESSEADGLAPGEGGYEEFIAWFVRTNGPVEYEDYEYPNPYVNCESHIWEAFGRPKEETPWLRAAVASLHDAGVVVADRTLEREQINGRKTYPAKYAVVVRAA